MIKVWMRWYDPSPGIGSFSGDFGIQKLCMLPRIDELIQFPTQHGSIWRVESVMHTPKDRWSKAEILVKRVK